MQTQVSIARAIHRGTRSAAAAPWPALYDRRIISSSVGPRQNRYQGPSPHSPQSETQKHALLRHAKDMQHAEALLIRCNSELEARVLTHLGHGFAAARSVPLTQSLKIRHMGLSCRRTLRLLRTARSRDQQNKSRQQRVLCAVLTDDRRFLCCPERVVWVEGRPSRRSRSSAKHDCSVSLRVSEIKSTR